MNNYGTNQQMKKKKKPEISFGFSINDDMILRIPADKFECLERDWKKVACLKNNV